MILTYFMHDLAFGNNVSKIMGPEAVRTSLYTQSQYS